MLRAGVDGPKLSYCPYIHNLSNHDPLTMDRIVTVDKAIDAIKTAADEIPVIKLHIICEKKRAKEHGPP
jgi:hypothetical protein